MLHSVRYRMAVPGAKRERVRLTPEDWARAALDALAEGGLAAVAVEPLAARLGATKGSFYWHFRDRAALIDAALLLWESEDTEAVISMLEELPDPMQRMRTLFAYTHPQDAAFPLESVMLAEARDPQVGPVLRRVTHRRVDYMTATLQRAGVPKTTARNRALLAYQAWIGHVQLQYAVGDVLPKGKARAAYLQHMLVTIEAGL